MVQAAANTTVDDGKSTLFWEDKWLSRYWICEMAPLIYDKILPRITKSKTVADALENNSWAGDVGPDLIADALVQFLHLWSRVAVVQVTENMDELVKQSWEKNGQFSARSPYAARFMGLEVSQTAAFTWGSRAPLHCRFFAWLAFKNKCWTSDRLACRGLPHQDSCPLCQQGEETIQHLLIDCVFARQIWH